MQCCPFFWTRNLIVHIYLECIAPVCFNSRAWKLAINEDDTFIHTIRCNESASECKVVRPYDTCWIVSPLYVCNEVGRAFAQL